MENEDEIIRAIGSHGLWKSRLNDAIRAGESRFDPSEVKLDNKCEFGLWLHGDIDAGLRATEHYRKAVALHAQFHEGAAEILRQATTGNKLRAKELVAPGSDYAKTSTRLTLVLMAWKKELALLGVS